MRDFLVIGAGSAGCVLAAELARREAGSVMVLEAGPSEVHPLVAMPMGLVWLMRSKRDWQFQTSPQEHAGNRQINVPRGKMVGGSGSINSMVWFRGRADDFDNWNISGWGFSDVAPAFAAVEAQLRPTPLATAHPLTKGLAGIFAETAPTPETESAGVFSYNLINGRRNSAARAFLRKRHDVEMRTGCNVDRLMWQGDKAVGVVLDDGSEIRAAKGVVLSAGSVASPAILMRSGVGPKDHLSAMGIDVRQDAPEVGENLHDHPGIGLHFEGASSGYGLEARQWLDWVLAPLNYGVRRAGAFASPTVEGGMFFNARGEEAAPDVQTHFIPFHLAHQGGRFQMKSGYFADVCLCRPKSRGTFRLASKDPTAAPVIDLGLFRDESDLDTMVAGVERLRSLLKQADFGSRRGIEAYPTEAVRGDALKEHIRRNCGTAYHPVGTLRMGGPVSSRLKVAGVDSLWVADASIMPAVTSANTNAPSMMIGWKGAEFIAEDVA
jgi:choline dehydrogenase